MVRLACIATLSALMAMPVAGQTAPNADQWRVRDLPAISTPRNLPGTDLGSRGRFGVGMFGLKKDHLLSPVTRQEVDAPKSRRAGVGFSLKF